MPTRSASIPMRGSNSFHFTFEEHSTIAEVMLAAKHDHDNWAVPIAHATAAFTRAKTAKGEIDLLQTGITHAFVANGLSEVQGLLAADNCFAGAVINLFFWPSVSSA